MRRTDLAIGEYYHIYNRGVEKRAIFLDSSDYWRFMAALIGFQGDADLNPVNRFVRLVKQREFNAEIFKEIVGKKYVDFNLMLRNQGRRNFKIYAAVIKFIYKVF